MLSTPANLIDTVIVGAGPYGLSVAAHLRDKGVPFHIFGRPMETWATQMPEGMHLRTNAVISNISAGKQTYALAQHLAQAERPVDDAERPMDDLNAPLALEDFLAYGREFTHRFVPNLQQESIRSIDRAENIFRLTTASGERIFARSVVLATGLNQMQSIPAEFKHLPSARLTHTSQHRSYREFAGREITVLGAGAGALNAAVLSHEAGARVTLLARSRKLRIDLRIDEATPQQPRTRMELAHGPANHKAVNPRSWILRNAPDLYRHLPAAVRGLAGHRSKPSGDAALRGRVHGFPILLGCRIHAIEAADGACDRLRLTLTDAHGEARQHLTSHLIAGTGYRVDKERLHLLSQSLREQIRTDGAGAPKLNRHFESSVPGLHFVGPLAASAFGPLLHDLAGTGFAAARVTAKLQRCFEERSSQKRSVAAGVLTRRERV